MPLQSVQRIGGIMGALRDAPITFAQLTEASTGGEHDGAHAHPH